jgi:hypothetical protein
MASNTILRVVVSVVVAAVLPLLAAFVAWRVAAFVAGPNVSDLGVQMYARGALSTLCGLVVYLVLLLGGLTLLVWKLKAPAAPVWGTGGAIGGAVLSILVVLLWLTYG